MQCSIQPDCRRCTRRPGPSRSESAASSGRGSGAQRSAREHQQTGPWFLRARLQWTARCARLEPMRRHARTTETPGHVSGVSPMGTLPSPVSEVTKSGGACCATQLRSVHDKHSKHSSASACLQLRLSVAADIVTRRPQTELRAHSAAVGRGAAPPYSSLPRCARAPAAGLRSASGSASPTQRRNHCAAQSASQLHAPGVAQRAAGTPSTQSQRHREPAAAQLSARWARKAHHDR